MSTVLIIILNYFTIALVMLPIFLPYIVAWEAVFVKVLQ